MNAILIHPDYWRNSQLSLARYYGMIRIDGKVYFHDKRSDYLVRDDFTKYISDIGMPTVIKAVKRYADERKAKKILNRLARIIKARRKVEKRQIQAEAETLFAQVEEYASKASDTVQRFVDSGYTTTR